jgi:hypothetical protein
MNNKEYFKSLSSEFEVLKNRVRNFIGDAHWLSDGEWKESVLRTVLRRHLPITIGVGSGFVVTPSKVSSQIDILLYDKTKPVLFQEGDFVIVTPDAVLGLIEVKTNVLRSKPPFRRNKKDIGEILYKLANNVELVCTKTLATRVFVSNRFFGLFSYQSEISDPFDVLDALKSITKENPRRIINAVSLGERMFVRYWDFDPENHKRIADKWNSYALNAIAPAYFVHNVIEHLCPHSVLENNSVWYPEEGKEVSKSGEISRKGASIVGTKPL